MQHVFTTIVKGYNKEYSKDILGFRKKRIPCRDFSLHGIPSILTIDSNKTKVNDLYEFFDRK